MGDLGVKVQHFPLTLLVVLTSELVSNVKLQYGTVHSCDGKTGGIGVAYTHYSIKNIFSLMDVKSQRCFNV